MKSPIPKKPIKPKGLTIIEEFLWESNAIEQEYSPEAFQDAKSAWNYIVRKKVLHISDVLEIHRRLGQRIAPKIAGKWRDCDVMIGGQYKRFISTQLIQHQVMDLLVQMRRVKELKTIRQKEEFTKHCHVVFEYVHPFVDINGRTGRCIWLWHRLQLGLPVKIIRADWPKAGGSQAAYYRWFSDEQ